ncbi:MAG: DUF362 domain-containing protein [Verrucomicrobia bacterium]|nr:DUF362 domain-containing protein [Verrucomicrobiota bacterium]
MPFTRRQFIRTGVGAAFAATPSAGVFSTLANPPANPKPAVSIVKIRNDNIPAAVEKAIDLLGGISAVTQGKNRILLKPNLVIDNPNCTTKPQVIHMLARLMQRAGKEVSIGEGSGDVSSITNGKATRCDDVLDRMQQWVFQRLGYTELAASLGVPLINLHLGDLVTLPVPNGLFWQEIALHRSLVETDLLCSVPMMKTHTYATVTLGLKNLIGLYPGSVYGSYRWWVHSNAYAKRSPGVAFEILDMAQVSRLGLTVIDGSTAMEGNGPANGPLIQMNLIIAGTHPLAADMVAASVMGFSPTEVPTFVWAQKLGMQPSALADIELRGETIASVRRPFVRPSLTTPVTSSDLYPAPKLRTERGSDGKAALTWDEATPKAIIEYTAEGKAKVGWTNTLQGGQSILEQNAQLGRPGWTRVIPATPGRHEFDLKPNTQHFFRLRKP